MRVYSSFASLRLVFSMLAVFLLAPLALAQFDTATVLGTVADAAGAALPKATVTLKNVATGITVQAQTDENGNYQFFNVKIGTYTLTAEAQGFSKAATENVQVTVNARQRVDFAMKAGALTETVTIAADAVRLETESSDRGQVINREQIVNLPLNGRSYADLALLSPGVRRSWLAAQETGTRDASFNVNGLRSALNNFIIDGVDNNSYGTNNQGFSNQVVQASPDAVQEFKVQTNNFSAEFGRAGGAVINASLRSGTNQFHGTAYEFLRNTSLNATGFFKPLRGIKPTLIQNQFGGTIGGPIIKDRTFFFADYEGYRRIFRTLQGNIQTIPTVANRQGILGVDVVAPFDFVDSTGKTITAGTRFAAGTAVPMTKFARQVIDAIPLPTSSAASNNYENLPRNKFYNDKGDVKIDHNFNERTNAFVRISHRKVNNFEAPTLPGPLFSSNANSFIRVLNQQLASGVTHNLTATSVMEFRFGISRTDAGKTPTGVGDPNFKVPGQPTDPRFAGGLTTQAIGGYLGLGRQSSNPQFQNPTVYNPRFNYTFLAGKHSFKTGYEYQAIFTEIDDFNPKYGQDSYSGQFSRPSGAGNNNLYNLADFFFGARSSYDLNNAVIIHLRQRMHFAYVQDDFKLNQKLTLNLGVRYEFATPQWEKDNLLANFDPATATLIPAKSGSIYDRALVNPDRNNWAPRLGFAWNALDKTVVRGGYGISYVHFNRLGGENLLSYNGPNIVGNSITQQPSQGICTGNNFLNCFRPTEAGYPTDFVAPSRFNPLTARVNFTPKDTRTGYVQSWHFSVQRELPGKWLVDLAYVGNRSNKLIILGDYNQARPNNASDPAAGTPLQNRRPFAAYSFVQASFNGGWTNYHAFQAKLERRFSDGLYLLNSFTWSKALDNAAGHLEANFGDNSRGNIRNLRNDKGLSNYDQPFNNTTSVVYDLPFGKGRRYLGSSNVAVDSVLGGWRATLINTMNSGLPVNLTYGPASAFVVGSSLTYRPNLTGANLYNDKNDPNNYLNPLGVAVPTDRTQPFGTAGRNIVRGPNFFQTDLGLHKAFPLWKESTKLEFRMEAFNLFNKTNFLTPDSSASNVRFDTAGNYTGTYGKITATFPARQIQFALKLIF
ncbi:MAG TPA: carboxypeptidase regulatory-like domain-containing protein [Blastocatellia bacterium]|nr:carboxypeptidase regulatory-like domain-containing protein [Blastocatellia bacterium]